MFDTSDYPVLPEASSWHEALAPGDVVSFVFPLAEPLCPGERPKRRPCLVLEIDVIDGERHALLAYGTTSSGRRNRGYEITVRDTAARAAAGLHEPSRFVGARRLRVPLSDSRFVSGASGSPVLGQLNAAGLDRMHAVRARMHAEHDIAAERRRSRDGERPRRRVALYRIKRLAAAEVR